MPLLILTFFLSCTPVPEGEEVALYHTYCGSCHIPPAIGALPKSVWKNSILPDMAYRMDIEGFYHGTQQSKEGFRPRIKFLDWVVLENYIVSLAPEKLPLTPIEDQELLSNFNPQVLQLDDQNGTFITFLDYEEDSRSVIVGDINGSVKRHGFQSGAIDQIYQGRTPVTGYSKIGALEFISEVGILDPSELELGKIVIKQGKDTVGLPHTFYRPVHNLTEDLDGDGILEMVVSEFGNHTGRLSLLVQKDSLQYEKKVLLSQPGCIRTLAKDMDADGKLDLITIVSQGNEGVTILYQKDGLVFVAERVLQFDPVYGSSWFELVDYDNDGFDDIVTVNGDNADKSYVHKPYHGMRIHLNDGKNNFKEAFFYPLNGATRLLAHDFDADGDMDFAIISTFPDYDRAPHLSFVYLENEDSDRFCFNTKVLQPSNLGRWFLMDKGDVDMDGDMDILLSSFTYSFTPVPNGLSQKWAREKTDILVLENTLY